MYLINLFGDGVSIEDAQEIFETAVRALRAATREDAALPVQGGLGVTDSGDDPIRRWSLTMSATKVQDEP